MESVNFIEMLRPVLSYLPRRHRYQLVVLLCLILFTALMETISLGSIALFVSSLTDPAGTFQMPYVQRAILILGIRIDNLKVFVTWIAVAVPVLFLMRSVCRGVMLFSINKFYALSEVFFGERLLSGFLSIDYEWILKRNTADLVLAILWRKQLGRGVIALTLNLLSEAVVVVCLLATIVVVQPVVSVTMVTVMSGLGLLVYTRLRKWLDITAERCRDFEQNINKVSTKAIHGVKDVRVSTTQNIFVDDFRNNALPLSHYYALQKFLAQAPSLIMQSMGIAILSGVVCMMLWAMEATLGTITGLMALLAVTAWRILPAISRMFNNITGLRKVLPYAATEIEYLKQIDEDNLQGTANTERELLFEREILVKGVSFAYKNQDRAILSNVTFSIHKAETLGIVGSSGAGKSTLADIMIGLLIPLYGGIYVDGKKLNHSNYRAWLQHIGYVPQFPYIYDGDLAGNIAFGVEKSRIERDRVLECCRMAAMDFLDDLPEGIDTPIGERGVRLSGGQQQRVVIARALYHKPEVLIFDEATSSLDAKSERSIQQTIYSFKGRQTLVIIAHRLSTVNDCDRIVWLHQGQVRGLDTPEVILPLYMREMQIREDRRHAE